MAAMHPSSGAGVDTVHDSVMKLRNTVMLEDDGAEKIHGALASGQLTAEDLSTRKLGAFLGRTTGAVYHRWGSLDGLLFAVSQRGFEDLGARLASVWAKSKSLADCAAAYVEFGLAQPAIYGLMFEHRFDWAALRSTGAFERVTPGSQLLTSVVCLLEESGSTNAVADTRLLMAGLHGIVSFATSGRMNTGELMSTDRAIALASARDLASRLTKTSTKKTSTPKKRAAR